MWDFKNKILLPMLFSKRNILFIRKKKSKYGESVQLVSLIDLKGKGKEKKIVWMNFKKDWMNVILIHVIPFVLFDFRLFLFLLFFFYLKNYLLIYDLIILLFKYIQFKSKSKNSRRKKNSLLSDCSLFCSYCRWCVELVFKCVMCVWLICVYSCCHLLLSIVRILALRVYWFGTRRLRSLLYCYSLVIVIAVSACSHYFRISNYRCSIAMCIVVIVSAD